MTTDTTVRDSALLDPTKLADMNQVGSALIRSAQQQIGLLSSLCVELQRLINEANERELRIAAFRTDEPTPPAVLN